MEAINRQVARRIKQLRAEKNLSLDELASRSGVSRAMLSQIETLKTNPTIAVIWKVAAGLDVSFAQLVEERTHTTIQLNRSKDARYLYSEDQSFCSRPLLNNVPGHSIEAYELFLKPETAHHADPHPDGSFEQLYVISGKIALEMNKERYELAQGDTLFFPADKPHLYQTLGKREFHGISLILYAG